MKWWTREREGVLQAKCNLLGRQFLRRYDQCACAPRILIAPFYSRECCGRGAWDRGGGGREDTRWGRIFIRSTFWTHYIFIWRFINNKPSLIVLFRYLELSKGRLMMRSRKPTGRWPSSTIQTRYHWELLSNRMWWRFLRIVGRSKPMMVRLKVDPGHYFETAICWPRWSQPSFCKLSVCNQIKQNRCVIMQKQQIIQLYFNNKLYLHSWKKILNCQTCVSGTFPTNCC